MKPLMNDDILTGTMSDVSKPGLEKLVESVYVMDSRYMNNWCYELGLILKAIEAVYEHTGQTRYLDYITGQIDRFVNEQGEIKDYDFYEFNLDNINPGKTLLFLYEKTCLQKYQSAARLLRLQLEKQPRTREGGFWHKRIYPHQMWLDGLYMSSPFLAQYAAVFNKTGIFDDVAYQIKLLYEHTRNAETGLLYHAYDESRGMKWANPETGCSPNFWGRAMGWFVMALADILDYFPNNHPERLNIVRILNFTMEALHKYQNPVTGVWYQIVDKSNSEGNYPESSASCMYTYAMLKGLRMGYLDSSMMNAAIKAYNGILEQFVSIGGSGMINLKNVCSVAGLGGNPYRNGSLEYYFGEPVVINDFKGYGPFILASVEYEKLCEMESGSAIGTGHESR